MRSLWISANDYVQLEKYILADGTVQKWRQAKYRCSGKAMGRTECNGQTIYSQPKIEETALEEIEKFLERLASVDLSDQLKNIKKKTSNNEEVEYKKLVKTAEGSKKELKTLTDEVAKSILGNSSFKPELLNSLIEQKEAELSTIEEHMARLEKKIKSKKIEQVELENLVSYIPVWKDLFREAPHEKQKKMLRTIVDYITVYRDRIELKIKVKITDLIDSVDGQYTKLTRSPS